MIRGGDAKEVRQRMPVEECAPPEPIPFYLILKG
jgi:hypothetical protein